MMKSKTLLTMFAILVLCSSLLLPLKKASAASLSPQDLINLMNNWRVNRYGYAPLVQNPILMGTAQWTADYMAANHLMDHIGNVSGRIMAAGFGGGKAICATENWAMGTNGLTMDEISAIWADAAHQMPSSELQYQEVGAGVANGPWGEYYIIHAACVRGYNAAATPDPNITPISTISNEINPLITSTPLEDGTIYHDVLSGQSLWAIAVAYFGPHPDMTAFEDEIRRLNNMSAESMLWVGAKLMIRPSITPTVSPTITPSPIPPTRTPTPQLGMMTAVPTRTLTPTATTPPTPGIFQSVNRRSVGIIIIAVCVVGFLALIFSSLFRRKTRKSAK